MALVRGAELTTSNGAAGIAEVSRAENEQLIRLAQTDVLASSTFGNPRWSGTSSGAYTENTETRDIPSTSFAFDDGLISMLDDGQIPQQLFSDQVSRYLDGGEADLRRNLERLLSQLQSQARGMAGREEADGIWNEAEDVSHFDPRTQYRDPATDTSIPFPLADPEDMSSLPVTCTFGTMRDGSLSFVSQDFRWFEASHFPDALNSQAEASVGMVFLTITNWQPWFLANLKSAVPTFPVRSVLHLSDNCPVTMLPLMDRYLSEMSCMTEHVDLAMDGDRETDNGLNIGSMRTKSRPFAVWTSARDAIPHHGQRPLVIVATSNSENIVSKIAGHYVQVKNGQVSHVRWERMRGNQTWVYLDLYNLFTKWDNVWEAIKSNLNTNLAEIHNKRSLISAGERAKQLHFGNNVMITLRERLRAHKASLKIVIQRNSESSEQQYWQSSEILSARLDDALQLLEYYDQSANSLLEQQQNLLSLSTTLENVSQSQAIASLNTLALVFLPLSLVASIFGFNTITVSPVYFPAAAVPALLLTIGIAYLASKLMSSNQQFLSKPRDTRPSDLEKLPVHRSVSTFNYPDVQRGESPWFLPRNLLRLIVPTQTPARSVAHPSLTNLPAPSPHIPTSHVRPRTSFESTHVSSSPYILRGNPNSESAQSSGNSLPRLPHLPTINPLWPPTTFPSFDQYEPPIAPATSRTSLHPESASSQGASPVRQLSPNVVIRKSSSRSPSREVSVDIGTSPAMIETLETAFPPPIPMRHPRSHIAFQLAEGSHSGSDIIHVPQEIVESSLSDTGSGGDLVEPMIIARGMGDITDTDDYSQTGTERSSSEMSSDEHIDYAEIARRQAEAFGFGVGFVSGSETASIISRPTVEESPAVEESASRAPDSSPTGSGTPMFSFGDQQIVLDALQASGLKIGPGYVGRLVSRFEGGSTPRKSPGTGPNSPVIEAGMYVVEQEIRGLGIYEPEKYEREDPGEEEHIELYDAEEDDYPTPKLPEEVQRASPVQETQQRPILETPIPIPPRHSSYFGTVSDVPRPPSIIARTNSPLVPITPPVVKTPPEEDLQRSESGSSNETAVTARTRPISLAAASNPTRSQEALGMYDADGFYASPTANRGQMHIERQGEHAEHPDGLEERNMLELMDSDSDVRSSWAASESWRRQQEEAEEAEAENTRRNQRVRIAEVSVVVAETESVSGTEGERSSSEVESSEVEQSDTYDEDEDDDDDDIGEGTIMDVERATRLLVNVGLGGSAGNRASAASGGSYSRGFLDTIPE